MAVWTSNESTTAVVDDAAIRPFTVEVPHEEIDELQRRVRATRWPDKETVDDRSQGVQTGEAAPLVEYWGDRLRLAQGRGRAQRVAAVHDRDRWAGHPVRA
jgi:hypothetical protein